jgi:pimeloyl-ACP methyl ester carboxylesterase
MSALNLWIECELCNGPLWQKDHDIHSSPRMTVEPPRIEGVEHRFVDAGGLRAHVAEAGDGDPVLLLHGWPQHHYMWHQVIPRLAPHYRLIAPDLRGFGWTEAPGHGYDGETFARDQIALLDALGIERVRLVGHDWGGWTSILLGLNFPQRIERMVALDTPHPWQRPRLSLLPELWRTWYAVANAIPGLGPWLHRRTDYVAGILRRGCAGSPFSEDELAAYADSFREPDRARAASALYRYYHRAFGQVWRGKWRDRRLAVPTLLMFGGRDLYVTPKLAQDYESHADDMRLEIVLDANHFLVDEQPELVSKRALQFFAA